MKNVKALILLAAFVIGLSATSCKTHQSCPAYGKAHSSRTHRG